jgi:tRNA threonylcarbamoyladenosine biosynthesis protein TsaB
VLLLALDTSGAGVSVALHDGERVLAQRSTDQPRRHAELLAPSISGVLDDAATSRTELTDLAVGIGPGPFTGLRVGLVTARVLGLALGVPVHGVCSLDALAQAVVDGAMADQEFMVAADARRREVYWAAYRSQAGLAVREDGPDVAAPALVPRGGRPVFGRGVLLYPQALGPLHEGAPLDVTGSQVARLVVHRMSAGIASPDPQPLYLRCPDAVEPGRPKRVLR